MSETKTVAKFLTIADFGEEEEFLREEHKKGWRFTRLTLPSFYHFEKCEPEDVVYRLDYKNNTESYDYMQMVKDYGWDCCYRCLGWLYFRKPASQIESENDGEIFSDKASRIDMIEKIVKTRMLPLTILFLCCVIPNSINAFSGRFGGFSAFFTIIWTIMFGLYIYLIVHCGLKLRKLRKDLE